MEVKVKAADVQNLWTIIVDGKEVGRAFYVQGMLYITPKTLKVSIQRVEQEIKKNVRL